MNNKLVSILATSTAVLGLLAIILFWKQAALDNSVKELNQSLSSATSISKAQDAINKFFTRNKQTTVSFLKSKASEGGASDVTITAASPTAGPKGAKITLTGNNIDLPAYVVFGPGVIESTIISQDPNTITFSVPGKVLTPSCAPFPASICAQLGLNGTTANQEIAINSGRYTIYVVNSQGSISNPISFQVQ